MTSLSLSAATLLLAGLVRGGPTASWGSSPWGSSPWGGSPPHGPSTEAPTCRCFPGDSCWPTASEWQEFNKTVNGKLVAAVPLASVCHNSEFGAYDAEQCAYVQNNWFYPDIHIPSFPSIMAPYFTNDSCNPFSTPDSPCTLGNFAPFAVNASNTDDYVKTLKFAQQHNIRLTIRNTGHDYMGKSTGAGSLTVWTHYMKDMEIVDYATPYYSGKALKMGAGVEVVESYKFSYEHGLINCGGDCPTVGVAGGYTQGGGHGPLASAFGLAADQALEWEVVTGEGEVLIASPTQNQDLYWALSGGGGGTYGIVSSLTVRAYPDRTTTAANLTFSTVGVDKDQLYDVVGTYFSVLPNVTGAGCYSNYFQTPESLVIEPATCPGLVKADMQALFDPILDKLALYNITNEWRITEYTNFYESYMAYNTPWTVANAQLGGRLIPRSLVENNLGALVDIVRNSIENYKLVVSAVGVDVSKADIVPGGNSVTPVWREAVFDFLLGTNYDYSNYTEDTYLADEMTNTYLPPVEKLTPGGGSYLNEANFQQPDYQQVFYGGNYDRLLEIKDKYDPDQMFYALTGVGSDRWYEDASQGGRLCPVA